ncbi:TetR family transcriptional regulator [Kaistia sp. 32K]|uniref:TetR/AcrR family transcriptional regulator n=1 Tax=Kaistia sp. 32K TaxID=2795690 RepID=UPI0019169C61|nr:TetR/AcrR family transcriptional regulator [Kaistia sp. 32K]BCP52112.1 TetR family transcriptional regulator [Kaistia sp. 32K]
MGRRPTIDREALLDAADRVIATTGVINLTIDAVAREAGVSKGGVLYSFGTKDALIEAMLERAEASYEGLVGAYLENHADEPFAPASAHIDANHREDRLASIRASALLASLVRSPAYQIQIQGYYEELFGRVDITTETGRRALTAILASEGAFLLRGLGLIDIENDAWDAIFADIQAIVPG